MKNYATKKKKKKRKRKRALASSMSYTQLLTISKIDKTHNIGKTKRETRKGELFLGTLFFCDKHWVRTLYLSIIYWGRFYLWIFCFKFLLIYNFNLISHVLEIIN